MKEGYLKIECVVFLRIIAIRKYLLLSLFLFCCSCAQQTSPLSFEKNEPTALVAEDLFLKGNYSEALHEFQQLHKAAFTIEEKNRALYGLACTQLILAKSENQINEALSNFDRWDNDNSQIVSSENRHLLFIAIKAFAERLEKKNLEQDKVAKQKNFVIANQRKKIAQMAETVESLQKQIEELEAIDESIQDKRRP